LVFRGVFGGRCAYLEAHECFALVVLIWRYTGGLAADDTKFHVLDLQTDEQKVDAADNDILQVVFALAVFEFNVQAVLDTDVHLDDAVGLRGHAVRVDPEILFAYNVLHAATHGDTDKVA
jgi:hypothetical protein